MKTLYDKLGVPRHASTSDIEMRYRHNLNEHIASNCNLPLRKNDELRLQQMRQAYLVLSSPSRRLEYDLALDQQERARLRRLEQLGTTLGLLLLLVGLALVARGYYRQVYAEQPVARAEHKAPDGRGQKDHAVLTADARNGASDAPGHRD